MIGENAFETTLYIEKHSSVKLLLQATETDSGSIHQNKNALE